MVAMLESIKESLEKVRVPLGEVGGLKLVIVEPPYANRLLSLVWSTEVPHLQENVPPRTLQQDCA
jgi:hypothetical protein